MSIITGVNGAVDTIPCVRNWSVTLTADTPTFSCSSNPGVMSRAAGNKDWSGTYTGYGGLPAKLPGEFFRFLGSIDGTNGVDSGATGAIVDSVEITWDIEGGQLIEHSVNFSANSNLTIGGAIATDGVAAATASTIGTKIETAAVSGSPSYSETIDVKTMTLTLSADNQSYVTSSTAGSTRRAAGNTDASLSYETYTDDFSNLPTQNQVLAYRLYINATEFWLLNWIRHGNISNLEVDIEGSALVGAQIEGGFVASAKVGGSEVKGVITKPGGGDFWP